MYLSQDDATVWHNYAGVDLLELITRVIYIFNFSLVSPGKLVARTITTREERKIEREILTRARATRDHASETKRLLLRFLRLR